MRPNLAVHEVPRVGRRDLVGEGGLLLELRALEVQVLQIPERLHPVADLFLSRRLTRPELERANLTGLVLGCIEAKFCKKICV